MRRASLRGLLAVAGVMLSACGGGQSAEDNRAPLDYEANPASTKSSSS